MTSAVELAGVTKRYGNIVAVDGLSLRVPEGSLFGLIGPNGAGKTTTFGLLCGYLRPDSGQVIVRGEAVAPGAPRVGKVVALPQDAELPRRMKIIDVLVMLGRLGGLDTAQAWTRSRAALSRVGLDGLEDRKVEALSHGQRRRVGIAQTLLGDREVILLDEPTSGLDPRAAAELRELVVSLRGPRTIVLSSHNLAEVEAICDHAAIIDRGKLVESSTMDELKREGGLVSISVSGPVPEEALVSIRALPGVRSASAERERLALALEASGGEVGSLTNSVLRILMDHGVVIGGVTRGQSLESRFLDETKG
ncbi:MAG: ABC transporter ATP-binding protein [Deltaproteobacteria bacterium]|nr:ABC transporter ATP-binding protein [Deltaproteobacteria bacterium]